MSMLFKCYQQPDGKGSKVTADNITNQELGGPFDSITVMLTLFSTGSVGEEGLCLTCVARLSTCWTNSCVSDGFFKNSFTMAVNKVSCTWRKTKKKEMRKVSDGQITFLVTADLRKYCLQWDIRFKQRQKG